MAKFAIRVEVAVHRTYIAEAEGLQEAVEKVETVLNAGNYDDTDDTKWESDGAVVVGYKIAPDDAVVDTEVQ